MGAVDRDSCRCDSLNRYERQTQIPKACGRMKATLAAVFPPIYVGHHLLERRFMTRAYAGLVVCFLLVTLSASADAQIVRFGGYGGVRIRAPFVSVDVLPWGGGTRVVAPFTSVNTGAYRYGYGPLYRSYRGYYPPGYVVPGAVPIAGYPAVPAPVYLPPPGVIATPLAPVGPVVLLRAPILPLADQLHAAAVRLSQSLSRRPDDAGVWMDYLSPDRILAAIDHRADPASLRDLLVHYDGVAANPQLASIIRAIGFAETHALLRQFVSVPLVPAVAVPVTEAIAEPPARVPPSVLDRATPIAPSPLPPVAAPPVDAPTPAKPPTEADRGSTDLGAADQTDADVVRRPAPTPI